MSNAANDGVAIRESVALLIDGKHDEAVALLRTVVGPEDRRSPDYWLLIGFALVNSGDRSGAERAFKRALEVGKGSLQRFDKLVRLLIANESYEQALEPLRLCIALTPEQDLAKLRLITVLTKLRRHGDAQKLCDELAHGQPEHPELLLRKAEIHMQLGRVNAAMQLFDKILAINPDSVTALMNKGLALQKTGNVDQAIVQFRRATSLKPNLDDAWYTLGLALLGKAEKEQALECFEKAFHINRTNLRAGDQLARMYGLFGRIEDAIAIYEMILEVQPDNARANFYLESYRSGVQPKQIPPEVIGPVYSARDAGKRFDQALVHSMDYRTPDILNRAVRESVQVPEEGLDIMEIGCGSGLCGSKFADIAHRLIGTDLSESMLEAARGKNAYDELYQADLVDVLSSNPSGFDLVLATDVLCFFGDLTEIFRKCYRTLKKNGVFGFSIEKPKSDELFILNNEGYFYHSLAHIRAAASEAGFEELYVNESVLRTELGVRRVGFICLFRRN